MFKLTRLLIFCIFTLNIAAFAADWPMFAGGPENIGRIAASVTQPAAMRYAYPLGEVVSSPVVVNGIIYVGDRNGAIHAVDLITGMRQWKYVTKGWVDSTPAVVNGKLYVGSRDHNFYCLNADTGTLVFSTDLGGQIISSPVVSGNRIYVGVGFPAHAIVALDASSGTVLWETATGQMVHSTPALSNGILYAGCNDGKLYGINVTDGSSAFILDTKGPFNMSSPAVYNGKVGFAPGDQDLMFYVIDALSGTSSGTGRLAPSSGDNPAYAPQRVSGLSRLNVVKAQRSVALEGKASEESSVSRPSYAPPAQAELTASSKAPQRTHTNSRYIYLPFAVVSSVAADNSYFYLVSGVPKSSYWRNTPSKPVALSAYSPADASEVWSYPLGVTSPLGLQPSPVITSDGIIAAGYMDTTGKSTVYCVNPADGSLLWSFEVEGEVVATPAPQDGYLVVATRSGLLMCLGDDDGSSLKLAGVEPRDGATDVMPDTSVEIFFFDGFDPSLVDDSMLRLVNTDSGSNIDFELTINSSSVELKPEEMLPRDVKVRVEMLNTLFDSNGDGSVAFSTEFTVMGGQATTLVSSRPGANWTSVSRKTDIVLNFSAPLWSENDWPLLVTLTDDLGPIGDLTYTVEGSGSILRISPEGELKPKMNHTVKIASGILDGAKVPVPPTSFTFTTADMERAIIKVEYSAGLNIVSPPVQVTMTASELAELLNSRFVIRVNEESGEFDIHFAGRQRNDFEIIPAHGYIVSMTEDREIIWEGEVLPAELDIPYGAALIGFGTAISPAYASEAVAETEARYIITFDEDSQRFIRYSQSGDPDFEIKTGYAYLIYTEEVVTMMKVAGRWMRAPSKRQASPGRVAKAPSISDISAFVTEKTRIADSSIKMDVSISGRPRALIKSTTADTLLKAISRAGVEAEKPYSQSGFSGTSSSEFKYHMRSGRHGYFFLEGIESADQEPYFDELLARVAGGEAVVLINCGLSDWSIIRTSQPVGRMSATDALYINLDSGKYTMQPDTSFYQIPSEVSGYNSGGEIEAKISSAAKEYLGIKTVDYGHGKIIFVNGLPSDQSMPGLIEAVMRMMPSVEESPGMPSVIQFRTRKLTQEALLTVSVTGSGWLEAEDGMLVDYRQVGINPVNSIATAIIPARYASETGSRSVATLKLLASDGEVLGQKELNLTVSDKLLSQILEEAVESISDELEIEENSENASDQGLRFKLQEASRLSWSNRPEDLQKVIEILTEVILTLKDEEVSEQISEVLRSVQIKYYNAVVK